MIDINKLKDRDINDDEIRIIGDCDENSVDDIKPDTDAYVKYDMSYEPLVQYSKALEIVDNSKSQKLLAKSRRLKARFRYAIIISSILIFALFIAIGSLIYYMNLNKAIYSEPEGIFEDVETVNMGCIALPDTTTLAVSEAESKSYVEVQDMVVNDVAMKIYIPHNGEMSLHLGPIDHNDTSIIYAAQAADVRADNGGIVGAFVVDGEPKAWGLSKKGYVASINSEVTVGVADNSPLFEKATECGGHFFRQYPLVGNGQMVPNKIRGKSIRRGICQRNGETFMVETINKESFHDFSLALVDMGVDQAVYLVGSTAAGWAVDANDSIHQFGDHNRYTSKKSIPKNISYIVWRRHEMPPQN